MVESAIFEIFDGLPRQGPGSNECTEKAFSMLSSLPADVKILDIGCGSGMQTIHLARICKNCHITAVDIYQPYLDNLMERAAIEGVFDRISTVCASMDDLPFGNNEFDVIWSEGAIFVMGFQKGLVYWKRLLKDGGFVALTEAAWFTDSPSGEVFKFWNECYPDITTIPQNEKRIETAGYSILGRFKLPASAWWDHCYVPLEKRLDSIGDKFKGNAEAESIIEFSRREMETFRQY
ncbi:class I SAM-dependent methyltransferase [uncultured Methanolobus sp.]|uniref:class I SAM-dependent methyltransferase n=1 Tax=uncultured Methanolobus sp. TaxID=218300 RepID=UPI0029C63FAB|nr:class I SAM-dependent methyltransferase [uncultured Methanolobus sp.]